MKKFANINYQQRPQCYWSDDSILALLLRDVKGTQRRRMIRDYWNQGRLEELHDELLKGSLSEESRVQLGRIHPSFMGGEYLPDCDACEIEIARIELQSTTRDVISIRAKRESAGVRYFVVDEYEGEFQYSLQRETSPAPLTLEELIEFIDGSEQDDLPGGLGLGFNRMNVDCDSDDRCPRKRFRHFTSVSSAFYRQLEEHFEHVFDDWVANDPNAEEDEEENA
jgi:hypothetical protein